MAWTVTNPVSIGSDTRKTDWDNIWDNCQFVYIPFGTIMLFGQSSAPTGWTKKTDWTNNSMLVYATGTPASGGTDDPTSGWTTAISAVNESTHDHSMSSHTHTFGSGNDLAGAGTGVTTTGGPIPSDTGSGSAHTHTITNDSFAPYYQKMIAATKDTGTWVSSNPVSAVGNPMKEPAHWNVLWANILEIYIEATTVCLFGQSTPPAGWTKKTDWTDNSMLVYTTGSISSGGSDTAHIWTTNILSTAENAHTHDLANHYHYLSDEPDVGRAAANYDYQTSGPSVNVTSVSIAAHNHTVNQDTFSPIYQKVIAGVKDSFDWITTDPVAIGDPTKKAQYDIAWNNVSNNAIPATTIMLFGQSSAPTGWTKKTDWTDNSMLVYTTGSISAGGTDNPTATWTTAISFDNESAHTHDMGDHTHTLPAGDVRESGSTTSDTSGGPSTNITGAGSAHTHAINQDSFAFLYQEIIAATKDA